ncbi:MAG TPA: hypothetical protein V6D43_24780, partial [Candidatus Sericytochromatia bacterium]
ENRVVAIEMLLPRLLTATSLTLHLDHTPLSLLSHSVGKLRCWDRDAFTTSASSNFPYPTPLTLLHCRCLSYKDTLFVPGQ